MLDLISTKTNIIEEHKKENKSDDVRPATSEDNIMSFF